ncbi:hypothetical protein DMENIID0001_131220 [Sergentomyia squamirostris]
MFGQKKAPQTESGRLRKERIFGQEKVTMVCASSEPLSLFSEVLKITLARSSITFTLEIRSEEGASNANFMGAIVIGVQAWGSLITVGAPAQTHTIRKDQVWGIWN